MLDLKKAMEYVPAPRLFSKLVAAACLLAVAACAPVGPVVQTNVDQADAIAARVMLMAATEAALAELNAGQAAAAPATELVPPAPTDSARNAAATAQPAVVEPTALPPTLEPLVPTAAPEPSAVPTELPVPPVWGYSGDYGPQAWAQMDPAYALCASGTGQSPIDLGGATVTDLADLRVDYEPAQLALANDGYTVRADYPAGSSVQVDGVSYALLNFELHHPSEHTVNGLPYDLEVQLIHQSAQGAIAVLSVFATAGPPNAAYQQLWDSLPLQAGATLPVPAAFNAASLLPTDRRTARYNGSFTTPPCTEGVRWLLFVQPVQLSEAQIAAFAAIFPNNSRPLQLAAGRLLQVDSKSR